jgi:hypothetical protein
VTRGDIESRALIYLLEIMREFQVSHGVVELQRHDLPLAIALLRIQRFDEAIFNFQTPPNPSSSAGSLLTRLERLEAELNSSKALIQVAEDRLREVGLSFESLAHLENAQLKERLGKIERGEWAPKTFTTTASTMAKALIPLASDETEKQV